MKEFKEEEWDLLYDSSFKEFKEKLRTRLLGDYQFGITYDNGSMRIRKIDEYQVPILVNGHRPKLYTKPLTKVEFTETPEEINSTLIQGRMMLKRLWAGLWHSNE